MARLPLFPEDINVEDQEVLDADGIPFLKPSQFKIPSVSEPVAKVASLPSSVSFQQAPIKATENTPIAEATKPQVESDVYGKGLEAGDLAVAQSNAAMGKGWGEVLAGLAKAGSGLMASGSGKAPAQVDAEGFRKAGALGEEGVKGIALLRQAKDQELKRKKDVLDANDETAMRDPNSSISKALREALRKVSPGLQIDDTTTGKQLRDSGVNLGSLLAAKMEADAKRIALEQSRETMKYNKELEANRQVQSRIDRQMVDYGDKVAAPAADLKNRMLRFEEAIGFPLDSANVEKGQLKVAGKKKDLPGVSIPGIGRVGFYSDEARNVQDAAFGIFNVVLKDRSGAAVTTPEMERLQKEFSAGKYNTEPELVRALKQYKRAATEALQQREKSFMPQVSQEFKSRGGLTAQDLGSPLQDHSQDVLDYANTHGITPEQAQAIKNKRLGK